MVAAGPSRQSIDRSLDRLGAALTAMPGEPDLLNDAAVAHALRADLGDDPRDLLLALELFDRALHVAPDHAPARFNRALVLTAMPLPGSAEIAWRHYLELPDEPGYRDEAYRALGAVGSTLGTAAMPERLRRLAKEARDGTIEPLLDLVASDPQRARELGLEHLLPAWAGARRTGDLAGADRLLTAARRLGQRLEDTNGECSLASMVEEIDAASGPAALERLAGAHVDYGEASRLFALLRSEEAAPGFDRVDRQAGGGALGLWARMGIGAVLFSRNDYPAAVATFEWLTSVPDDGCLRALAGRAAWGLGVTRLRQGHYVAALRHLRRAEALFLALGERENLGAIRHLLATTHHQLGRDEEAWSLYFEALAALGRDRGSLRLHSLLWESARAAETSLGPRAALVLQEEAVRNATAAENQGLLPEALLWRARFRTAAGDTKGALEDLEAARRWNDRRPPGPAPARIAAD
ncbi:MAG TPA: tetratricopeptide repeat protein, partial [Thermoanaerobaculia bacterium]|nr:tetratricopeptide repeat protein [Thermoanaerobaculia bacterium]